MSLRIFEDVAEAPEPVQPADVSFPARLLLCGWAALVAAVPVVTTIFSAYGVTGLFRSMTDAESASASRVLGGLDFFNKPLIISFGIAALLAFGLALVLALKPRLRSASVGLPFSYGVPILATIPAGFLWLTESTTIDLISGKVTDTPVTVVAQTISTLLFVALGSSLLMQGVILVCAIVSLCIPPRKRTDALSSRRPFAWAVSGMLLLVFAVAYFVLV